MMLKQRVAVYIAVLFFFTLNSCVHTEESMNTIEYPNTLATAKQALEQKDFSRAEAQIHAYLNSPKDIYWHGHAYLLLGESREAEGRNDGAIESYTQAISHGAGYDDKVVSQALYRISWVYERLAKYNDMVTALTDLEKMITNSDFFVRNIETPSRLANAYYVLDLKEKALDYRNRVTPALLREAQTRNIPPRLLQQAAFYRAFAALTPARANQQDPAELIPLVQKELLDVAEMAELNLAERAYKQLLTLYKVEWQRLKENKTFKKPEERINFNKGKVDQVAHFIDWVEDLKSSRRPQELVSHAHLSVQFFRDLDGIEKSARQYVSSFELGPQRDSSKRRK